MNSGGLAPITAATAGDVVTEILYNRTYSLLFEQGARWVDARRYGRLAQLPKVNTGAIAELIFPWVMFPDAECAQRKQQPAAACTQVAGM